MLNNAAIVRLETVSSPRWDGGGRRRGITLVLSGNNSQGETGALIMYVSAENIISTYIVRMPRL